MDNRFFEQPILNSPYEYPRQHWGLDESGHKAAQTEMVFDEGRGLSGEKQQYDPTSAIINELRYLVDQWREQRWRVVEC